MALKIAVLGTGNMGKALIGGLLKTCKDAVITVWDLRSEALDNLDKRVKTVPAEEWLTKGNPPDVVVIAVKPADMDRALRGFTGSAEVKNPLWISIAAGRNIASIISLLSSDARVCRVMPNTPALIGEGISAYTLNANCIASDEELVKIVLHSCGKSISVPEKMMDAITGLSGSGPAYVYLFIESLIDGGVTAGLPYQIARECAIQTVLGAAKMVEQTGENPATLKSQVMSPGGTTASGLKALEQNAFRHAVIDAVIAATKRSAELGS